MTTGKRQGILSTALCVFALAGVAAGLSACKAEAEKAEGPAPHESIARIKHSCREAADAIRQRQAEQSLYDRIGGREELRAVVDEIIRLHRQNDAIAHHFEGVNADRAAAGVTDWMAAHYGGPADYTGRNMIETHAHMEVTDAQFLAAGGDIKKALGNLGYGKKITQEVVCSLMPYHEQVVTK